MTNVELRRGSELEQDARKVTGLPEKRLHPYPNGYRDEPPDGQDDNFGKSYSQRDDVTPKKKTPRGGISYVTTIPVVTHPVDDGEEVEVCLGSQGHYIPLAVNTNASQDEIEILALPAL
jgi:hypothetical protein